MPFALPTPRPRGEGSPTQDLVDLGSRTRVHFGGQDRAALFWLYLERIKEGGVQLIFKNAKAAALQHFDDGTHALVVHTTDGLPAIQAIQCSRSTGCELGSGAACIPVDGAAHRVVIANTAQ